MRWKELLAALPQKEMIAEANPSVTGLAFDSRKVGPGEVFVAIKGLQEDGHRYIPQALKAGAAALVIADRQASGMIPPSIPYAIVPDSRLALAQLAAAFYGFPGRKLKVIGITGTDGKTTTVTLTQSVLEAAGIPCGMLTTVAAEIGGVSYDTGLHTTTPDAVAVQGYLARMVKAGCQAAAIEATSHGLAQERVAACEFDVAAITNLTHEHLDYHGTFESYLGAKARLFQALATSFRKPHTPKAAVLNADDVSYASLRGIPADLHLAYGLRSPADVSASDIQVGLQGLRFTAHTPQGPFAARSPLLGGHNVYNALAAIAIALSQGVDTPAIQEGIQRVERVEGRMEKVEAGQDFIAIVDFAHTPNALENALRSARRLTRGRVIVIFGCPGLRDRAKRPMMGEVAGRLADLVVITADDPRTEDLDDIMEEVAEGCRRAGRVGGKDFWRIGDRAQAIAYAVTLAGPGDLVLAAGKGHEKSLAIGEVEYPWSDHEVLRQAIIERLKGK